MSLLKPKTETIVSAEVLKRDPLTQDSQRGELTSQVGVLDKMRLNRSTSKLATASLQNIEQRRITALQNIEVTAISLAETQLRQSLVASSLTTIGTLTTQVNSQTAAVRGALTSGLGAEILSHVKNRDANNRVVNHFVTTGTITSDEGEEIKAVLYDVSRDDIKAGIARTDKSKAAVEALAAHAIDGLERTKDFLQ